MLASTWYCSGSAVHPAHGLQAVLLAQPVGHVGERQPGGHQPLRLDLDDDLANVAALHGHVGNVVDAADPRPQIVIGVVVQAPTDRARRSPRTR